MRPGTKIVIDQHSAPHLENALQDAASLPPLKEDLKFTALRRRWCKLQTAEQRRKALTCTGALIRLACPLKADVTVKGYHMLQIAL